jgi:hypothetical protein
MLAPRIRIWAQKQVARTAGFAVRVSSPVRRGSKRTVLTKYRSEPKGRRNLDTALHYDAVEIIATEQTRTATPAVRATGYCRGGEGGGDLPDSPTKVDIDPRPR